MLALANKTDPQLNYRHKLRKNCACTPCQEMRQEGCENLHKYGESAREWISKLKRKWSPKECDDVRKFAPEEEELVKQVGVHSIQKS